MDARWSSGAYDNSGACAGTVTFNEATGITSVPAHTRYIHHQQYARPVRVEATVMSDLEVVPDGGVLGLNLFPLRKEPPGNDFDKGYVLRVGEGDSGWYSWPPGAGEVQTPRASDTSFSTKEWRRLAIEVGLTTVRWFIDDMTTPIRQEKLSDLKWKGTEPTSGRLVIEARDAVLVKDVRVTTGMPMPSPRPNDAWVLRSRSTFQTTRFWEFVSAGVEGTPRGRSSACQQRDNCPTLTENNCSSPVAWDMQCTQRIPEHTTQ